VRLALAGLLASAVAHAQPVPHELAALAPAPDARQALPIGPHGELYQPDGKGSWVRRQAATIAGDVAFATRGASAIAVTKDGVPFRDARDLWTGIVLGQHPAAIVGAGSRPIAAQGRALFALDRMPAVKLGDAPEPVIALAASATTVVIETEHGLFRLERGAWKPVKGAPPRVDALLSERFARVGNAVLDLTTNKTWPWPTGAHIDFAIADGDTVLAAAGGATISLVTLHAGKLASEAVPLDPPAPVIGLATDHAGRVVVAARDGRLAVRDHGVWTTTTLTDELPSPHPGSPPARSR
jgi:hypothetical protein